MAFFGCSILRNEELALILLFEIMERQKIMINFSKMRVFRVMATAALAVASIIGIGTKLHAQEAPAAPATLFAYPVAPDTISTLEGRTNYIVSRFWDNFNLSKHIADSAAFDGAFRDYVTFFKYAHRNIVFSSIKQFMNRAQSNLANYIMIMEIAEKALYAPGAEFWSDEAYLPFAQAFVASKKVKSVHKQRYQAQIKKIEQNKTGAIAPDFSYTTPDKQKHRFSEVTGCPILLFFNDPDCLDCSIARLRLSTDVTLNKLIDAGEVKVVSIYPDSYSREWADDARGYSDKWIIGASEEAGDNYDIRYSPSFYLLDKDHSIIDKNINLETVKALFNR